MKEPLVTKENSVRSLFFILSLPVRAFKALFFDPIETETGEVKRICFSLLRTVFVFLMVIVLARLLFGGFEVETLEIARQTTQERQKPQREEAQSSGQKSKQTEKAANTDKKKKTSASSKPSLSASPALLKIKGLKVHPFSFYEICAALMIVALYYNRRELNQGASKGNLERWADLLGIAWAAKNLPSASAELLLQRTDSSLLKKEKSGAMKKETQKIEPSASPSSPASVSPSPSVSPSVSPSPPASVSPSVSVSPSPPASPSQKEDQVDLDFLSMSHSSRIEESEEIVVSERRKKK